MNQNARMGSIRVTRDTDCHIYLWPTVAININRLHDFEMTITAKLCAKK